MNRRQRKAIAGGAHNIAVIFPPMIFPLVKDVDIGRNDPCPCGSGKKYKQCCLTSGRYEHYKQLKNNNNGQDSSKG